MQTIALPQKVEYRAGDKPNQGKVIVEPCFPGYGITLGNALRRVMLSSLPGAAVVGVKIEGASHEFTALPHLKEDILEFILNLKKMRMKVHSDEPIKLHLEVHGEKEIKASDIEKDASVEIANPDLVLGHITDMSGSLQADIHVSRGMGYVMIESREQGNKDIGYIEMDSVFSPVLFVGIKVENVRVGKMTNWDKLVFDVTTDGTMSFEDAFKGAVKILLDQYGALAVDGAENMAAAAEGEEEKEKGEDAKVPAEEGKEDSAVATAEDDEPPAGEDEEGKPKKKRGRPKKS